MKLFPLMLLAVLLAACSAIPAQTPSEPGQATASVAASETNTPAAPTATSVPMAFTVNGEGLSLVEFNAELARYRQSQAELGFEISEQDATPIVIEDLIVQVLLAQAAREAGFALDESALQERIDSLTAQLGSAEALAAWQLTHGYDEASFRVALKRSAESAQMRDKILSSVPTTAEQVHVRQILTYNQEDAQRAKSRLDSGSDFDELAALYDPATRGDIGWFPREYLGLKVVEDTAFALEVNSVSDIIPSEIGFHIVKIVERDPARPLAFDALLALQTKALAEWVETRRAQSEIAILVK